MENTDIQTRIAAALQNFDMALLELEKLGIEVEEQKALSNEAKKYNEQLLDNKA